MRFGGRTAFITGAAIGFGRAFARVLDECASVAIVDIDVDMAERTAAELVSDAGQAIAVDCVRSATTEDAGP